MKKKLAFLILLAMLVSICSGIGVYAAGDTDGVGGYIEFDASKSGGYNAYYKRAMLLKNLNYTVSFDYKADTTSFGIMFDVENGSHGAAIGVNPASENLNKWTSYSGTFTPLVDYTDSNADGFPSRVYTVYSGTGKCLIDNFKITAPDGSVVFSEDFTAVNDDFDWLSGGASHKTGHTDLSALSSTEEGGFIKLQSISAAADHYCAYYQRLTLMGGKTYTVTADVMSNNLECDPLFDLEGAGGVASVSFKPSEAEKWETITTTITPNADYTGDGYPGRFYCTYTGDAQTLIDNFSVTDASGNVIFAADLSAWAATANTWLPGNAVYVPFTGALTDLIGLPENEDAGFAALSPTDTEGYAAVYMRAKLLAGKTYTVTFKAMTNNVAMPVSIDLEGQGGVTMLTSQLSKSDTWQTKSVTISPTESYSASASEETRNLGFPIRFYTNTQMAATILIDDVAITDGIATITSESFAATRNDGTLWGAGKGAVIPSGYVPPKDDEVLGFNELINGSFENSNQMKYWWNRTDWNGGSWNRVAAAGVGGSYGLVATGSGDGASDKNAGIFYTLSGEGHEATLPLTEGGTYVLTFKAFRPAGSTARVYIDINEGGAASASSSDITGEWETVTTRFVAPKGAVKIRLIANGLATGKNVTVDDIELRLVGGDPDGNPRTADSMIVGIAIASLLITSIGACTLVVFRRKHNA